MRMRAFLHRMPRGGDLHVHLSSAVYAERFIAWAAQDGLCANWSDVMQAGTRCDQPGDVLISQALRDQQFYDRLVNDFSTRAYLPSVHVPTEHDAFFATFARFGAASGSHFADMMIDQLRQ
jgi:adenosine deaminase